MGFLDKAIKLAASAGGTQKEGLKLLQESLAALGRQQLSDEAKRGAVAALTEVMAGLKRRGLSSPETDEEAERIVSLFAPLSASKEGSHS